MRSNSQSDIISIQRSISINEPPAKVFALINDFRCWQIWSPWEKLDPLMDRFFSDNAAGQGATYAWKGKAGTGHMEIITSSEATQIIIHLEIIKPFAAHNRVEFTLQTSDSAYDPASDQITVLTWGMHGPKPYLAKLIGIFFNMDKFLAKDLDKGLKNLKALAEAQ